HTYKVSTNFPRDEIYGLTSQMRRAAASIAANIAEGCGRRSPAEFGRFLSIAAGSASELQYHLLLARDLGFLSPPTHARLDQDVAEVKRMLTALLKKLTAES
ncbi:MAG TPA: four helix bundle protein, partial [Candidatus Dormibacteraeota bacterium]|nr:four helix bundle protein [Candidatus Dormibacteraeota bacterium]